MAAFASIILRIFAATFANVLQKTLTYSGCGPQAIVLTSYLLQCVPCLVLLYLDHTKWTFEFCLAISLGGALDAVGNLFILLSLRTTDLSIFGPLNGFKAVIATLLSMIFLGEAPSLLGAIGMGTILIGSFFLAPAGAGTLAVRLQSLVSSRGVWYRLVALVIFSVGTIFLKRAVSTGSVIAALAAWTFVGAITTLSIEGVRVRGQIVVVLSKQSKYVSRYVPLVVLLFLMQWATLSAFRQMNVGYALALFQLGMVLQVVWGHAFFKEQHFMQRLWGASIMLLGSVMILYA